MKIQILSYRPKVNLSVVTLFISLCAMSSQAAVLLSDDFNRTGSLNGSSPTVGATTWNAPLSNYTTDGSALQIASSLASANMTFTLTSGLVYELSADITITSGSWAAIGFSNSSNQGGFTGGSLAAAPWAFLAPNGSMQAFGGTATSNNFVTLGANTVTAGVTHNVRLNLDTTAPLWKASMFVDNVQRGSTFTFASNPSISRIVLGTQNSAASFDNLLFQTQSVPEPSTWALLLGGVACVFVLRRRKSSAQ